MSEENMLVEEGEYKGNPMLILKRNLDDKYPVQLGVSKLNLILENIDEVKAFVEKHKK